MESCESTFQTWLSSGVQRFQVNSSRCGPISPRSSRGEDRPSYTHMVWMSAAPHPSSQVVIPQMISDAFLACQNVPKFQANTVIIIILGYKVSILFWLSCHPATFHPSIPILQKKRLTYFIASFWWNSQILTKKKHALLTCSRTWYTKMKVHFTDQTFVILPERNVAKEILLFGFERT